MSFAIFMMAPDQFQIINIIFTPVIPIQEYQLAKMRIIPNTILYVIFLCSGITFDYLMIRFVRNRNQIQPTEMVPWKSVSPQDKVSKRMNCEKSKMVFCYQNCSDLL